MTAHGKLTALSASTYVGVGVLVLVAGIGLDVLLTRPSVSRIQALKVERSDIETRIRQARSLAHESEQLAHRLGGDDLAGVLQSLGKEDPVAYLGREITDAGLARVELTRLDESRTERVARNRFSLRVRGSFDGTLRFVRKLEEGTRLVTIEALSIAPEQEGRGLESRLDLSIYDPISTK
jgi:Tfp pilus assembly protein PilO